MNARTLLLIIHANGQEGRANVSPKPFSAHSVPPRQPTRRRGKESNSCRAFLPPFSARKKQRPALLFYCREIKKYLPTIISQRREIIFYCRLFRKTGKNLKNREKPVLFLIEGVVGFIEGAWVRRCGSTRLALQMETPSLYNAFTYLRTFAPSHPRKDKKKRTDYWFFPVFLVFLGFSKKYIRRGMLAKGTTKISPENRKLLSGDIFLSSGDNFLLPGVTKLSPDNTITFSIKIHSRGGILRSAPDRKALKGLCFHRHPNELFGIK